MNENHVPHGLSSSEEQQPQPLSSAAPDVLDSIELDERLTDISKETRNRITEVMDLDFIVREFLQPGMALFDAQGVPVLHVFDDNDEEMTFIHFLSDEEKQEREKKGKKDRSSRVIPLKKDPKGTLEQRFRKLMKRYGALYYIPLKLDPTRKAMTMLDEKEGLKAVQEQLDSGEFSVDNLEMLIHNSPDEVIKALLDTDYGSQRLFFAHRQKFNLEEMTSTQLRQQVLNVVKSHRRRFFKVAPKSGISSALQERLGKLYTDLIDYLEEHIEMAQFVEGLQKGEQLQIDGLYALPIYGRTPDGELVVMHYEPSNNPILVIKGTSRLSPNGTLNVRILSPSGRLLAKNPRFHVMELKRLYQLGKLHKRDEQVEEEEEPKSPPTEENTPASDFSAAFEQPLEVPELSRGDRRSVLQALDSAGAIAALDMEQISDLATWAEAHQQRFTREYLKDQELALEADDPRMQKVIAQLIKRRSSWEEVNPKALGRIQRMLRAHQKVMTVRAEGFLEQHAGDERLVLEAKLAAIPTLFGIMDRYLQQREESLRQERKTLLGSLSSGDEFQRGEQVYTIRELQQDDSGQIKQVICDVRGSQGKQVSSKAIRAQRFFRWFKRGTLQPLLQGAIKPPKAIPGKKRA